MTFYLLITQLLFFFSSKRNEKMRCVLVEMYSFDFENSQKQNAEYGNSYRNLQLMLLIVKENMLTATKSQPETQKYREGMKQTPESTTTPMQNWIFLKK